jgi:hypothetical protein
MVFAMPNIIALTFYAMTIFPCYIGSFLILEKLGAMAYKLELPPSLAGVHDVFHISWLKKCLKAPTNVVVNDVTRLEADLSYPEHPVKLLGK